MRYQCSILHINAEKKIIQYNRLIINVYMLVIIEGRGIKITRLYLISKEFCSPENATIIIEKSYKHTL